MRSRKKRGVEAGHRDPDGAEVERGPAARPVEGLRRSSRRLKSELLRGWAPGACCRFVRCGKRVVSAPGIPDVEGRLAFCKGGVNATSPS